MFPSIEAKVLSHTLSAHALVLFEALGGAIKNALVGKNLEREVLEGLLTELPAHLEALEIPDVKFQCRHKKIHQKPIVSTPAGRCELGDMLVVVKYHLPDHTCVAKSIVYQLKLATAGKTSCRIDKKQLALLRDWPCFSFGQRRDGGSQEYLIRPESMEFGSYMLEPRCPEAKHGEGRWLVSRGTPFGASITTFFSPYGSCPTAWQCIEDSQTSADIHPSHPTVLPDVFAFLAHLLFQSGEPHSNHDVHRLVSALYRFTGLAPDPPDEFVEFQKRDEDDGFLVLEINVHHFPDDEAPERDSRSD